MIEKGLVKRISIILAGSSQSVASDPRSLFHIQRDAAPDLNMCSRLMYNRRLEDSVRLVRNECIKTDLADQWSSTIQA